MAGGTDMPFGRADPWQAMAAAVARTTAAGRVLGADERLTPEQALSLFLGAADAPALPRAVSLGATADLCLLSCGWAEARKTLDGANVAAAIVSGETAWRRP